MGGFRGWAGIWRLYIVGVMSRRRVLAVAGVVVVVVAGTAVWLWPPEQRRAFVTLVHDEVVTAVTFTPDGRTLLTAERPGPAGGGPVRLWDHAAGTVVSTLDNAVGSDPTMDLHPDGRRLITAGRDVPVRLWDLTTGQATALGQRAEDVSAIRFSTDGSGFATAGAEGVRVRLTRTGADVATLEHGATAARTVAFDTINLFVFGGDATGRIRMWDAIDGRLAGPVEAGVADVAVLVVGPGRTLAVGGSSGQVAWLSFAGSVEPTVVRAGDRRVGDLAFSPDGTVLATVDASGDPSGTGDVTVRLWTVATGELSAEFPIAGEDHHGVRCSPDPTVDTQLAFSPDGTILAATCGHTVRLWRLP